MVTTSHLFLYKRESPSGLITGLVQVPPFARTQIEGRRRREVRDTERKERRGWGRTSGEEGVGQDKGKEGLRRTVPVAPHREFKTSTSNKHSRLTMAGKSQQNSHDQSKGERERLISNCASRLVDTRVTAETPKNIKRP